MSLYILIENQKLLWETMNKLPQFQEFGKNDPKQQQKWFQEIVQNFYDSNKFKLLSVNELQQLNRDTLSYMLRDIKNVKLQVISPVFSNFSSPQYDRFDEPTIFTANPTFPTNNDQKSVTRDFLMEKKHEELNRQFSVRQQEYSAMLKRGPDQEIDFRLPMDADEPIENIDQLIKNQIQQRNIEPPSSFQGVDPPIKKNNSLEFLQKTLRPILDSDNVEVDASSLFLNRDALPDNIVEEIVPPKRSEQFPFRDVHQKKNVKWSESIVTPTQIHHPPSYSLKEREKQNEEFKLIKEFMIEMRDSVDHLKREVLDLKTQVLIPASSSNFNDFQIGIEKPNIFIHSTVPINESLELKCDTLY